MNCVECQLAYQKTRKPYVMSCGHTFCGECLKPSQISKCFICSVKGSPVLNIAMYEQVLRKNYRNIDKFLKICLFGNMGVGKSSVLKRLTGQEFNLHMDPTVGIDFKYIDKEIDGLTYRFQIWDSAGQ